MAAGRSPQLDGGARGDARGSRSGGVLEGVGAKSVPASEDDWGKEFLSLVAAVKVVGSLDEAIGHIRSRGSGHSEAIVTSRRRAAARFLSEVTRRRCSSTPVPSSPTAASSVWERKSVSRRRNSMRAGQWACRS